MRASRSAPSSSAATMNSDFARAWGSAKRAPRPLASKYRPLPSRARATRSGYASAVSTPTISIGFRDLLATAELALPVIGGTLRLPQRARVNRETAGQRACAAQGADAQAQVCIACAGRRAQHVALAENGGDLAREARRPQVPALDQQVCESRMSAHGGERAAMRGDAPGRVHRAQASQEIACLRERRRGRRIEPAQAPGIRRAPAGELERERCEVRMQDLGRRLCDERRLHALGPQAVADPGTQTTGAAAPLVGGGLR